MAGARITAENLEYSHGEVATLSGISFAVKPDETVAIVGPSGCGKSTLLSLIAGLAEPDAGRITIEHEESRAAGNGDRAPSQARPAAPQASGSRATGRLAACALMPQRDLLLPWHDALDNAALALLNRGMRRTEARQRAAATFERFGLAGFEKALPKQLSGGMRQRVAFVRTLLAGKPILLLDEPFAALDAITRADMQGWLAEAITAEPRTLVLVTHDVEEALYLADRVLIFTSRPARIAGEIISPAPRSPDRAAALADPYFIEQRSRAMELLSSAHIGSEAQERAAEVPA